MTTTIVTKPNSKSYAIYVDGKLTIKCKNPLVEPNELVKDLGLDADTVIVIAMNVFPEQLDNDFENNLLSVNDNTTDDTLTVDFDKNMVIDFDVPSIKNNQDLIDKLENINIVRTNGTVPSGDLVASNEIQVGDLVYVESIDEVLTKTSGGIGVISAVRNIQELETEVLETEIYDEYDDHDYTSIDEIERSNYMFEIESLPNVWFNWDHLKTMQSKLKKQYKNQYSSRV